MLERTNTELFTTYLNNLEIIKTYDHPNMLSKVYIQLNNKRNLVQHYGNLIRNYINDSVDVENLIESNESSRFLQQIEKLNGEYSAIERGLKDSIKIFVVGTGNYGKSTVINSLIGSRTEFAPIGKVPKTWKIDIYDSHLDDNQVEVIYKDGSISYYDNIQAKKLISDEEEKIKLSEKSARKLYRQAKNEEKMSEEQLKEYKLKLDRDEVIKSDITEVRWPVPANGLLKKICLVDTPGFNQNNYSGEVINNAKEYYKKAEGVLWLLDAKVTSSAMSEEVVAGLLDELKEIESEIGDTRKVEDKIAILNFIDQVDEKDRDKVITTAEKIYGKYFSKIIPYSAKNAYTAIVNTDNELLESSGRNKLVNMIDQVFISNAEKIKEHGKKRFIKSTTEESVNLFKNYKKVVKDDYTVYQNYKEAIYQLLKDEERFLYSDFEKALDTHHRDINSQLETRLQYIEDNFKETPTKSDIENLIFEKRSLVTLISSMQKKVKQRMFEVSEEINNKYNFYQYEHLDKPKPIKANLKNVNKLEIKTDTVFFMPDITKSALSTGAIGLIFGPIGGIIGAGIGAYSSMKMRESTQREFRLEIMKAIDNIKLTFRESLETYCLEVMEECLIHLENKFKEKYLFKLELSMYEITSVMMLCNDVVSKLEKETDDPYTQMLYQITAG